MTNDNEATSQTPPSGDEAAAPLDAGDQAEREQFESAFDNESFSGGDFESSEFARGEYEDVQDSVEEAHTDPAVLDQTSEPYLGQWNRLISSTNWEKGRIISEWRAALIESGAASSEYSDEAWARRAGGVTAPHVGRLRRVHDRFSETRESFPGLYWSHFLAALDWDDAAMWLEGAMRSGWSISQMREQRWQTQGSQPDQKPNPDDLAAVDMDEDIIEPAQGGGGSGKYRDDEPDGVSAGPDYEGPDFGDEPSRDGLNAAGEADASPGDAEAAPPAELIQPFRDLPELPDDLSEAVEMLKLAILRHKAEKWAAVEASDVVRYLVGLRMLVEAPNG